MQCGAVTRGGESGCVIRLSVALRMSVLQKTEEKDESLSHSTEDTSGLLR